MTKKFNSIIVDVPIFKSKLSLICTNDVHKLKDIIEFNDDSIWCHTLYNVINDTVLIVINPYDTKINNGMIVHECVHAANMILESIGHISSESNDEVQAYLVEFIYNKIYIMLDDMKLIDKIRRYAN